MRSAKYLCILRILYNKDKLRTYHDNYWGVWLWDLPISRKNWENCWSYQNWFGTVLLCMYYSKLMKYVAKILIWPFLSQYGTDSRLNRQMIRVIRLLRTLSKPWESMRTIAFLSRTDNRHFRIKILRQWPVVNQK